MVATNVLGTTYTVTLTDLNNPEFAENDGKCYIFEKKIVVRQPKYLLMNGTDEAKKERFRHVMLHELVHGFCEESKVHYDDNENLVDWIAGMIPKIVDSYNDIIDQLKEQEDGENQD